MEDFWRPIIQEEYSEVRQPATEGNNFELKPTLITMVQPAIKGNNIELNLALITMVQQHQFNSHPSEDPNEHMGRLMRMTNTVKLNGVRSEVIKL